MIYQIFDKTQAGEVRWSWRLLDKENKEVGVSESFFTKGEIISHIKKLRVEISSAEIVNINNSKDTNKDLGFEFFKDGNNWYWKLKQGDQEVAKGTIPNDFFKGKDVEGTIEDWIKNIREIMQKAEPKWENEKDDPAYQEKTDDNTPTKGIAGSCSVENIKADLAPALNDCFNWQIDFIDNQDGPMLFILNYSDEAANLASFALSLSEYNNNALPYKCWMTNKKITAINGNKPKSNPDYKEFIYQDQMFYPFSIALSEYKIKDIRTIIKELYCHIDWS